jgi:opacity protein-like surface antigen
LHTNRFTTEDSSSFFAGDEQTPRKAAGPLGGLTSGAQLQFGQVVLGVESMWAGSRILSDPRTFCNINVVTVPPGDLGTACGTFHPTQNPNPGGRFNISEGNTNQIYTIAGRLGFAMDRWLVYGKGGAAWTHFTANTVSYSSADPAVATLNTASSGWLHGWTAGGGIEYAFNNTISIKVEYDYIGIPNQITHGVVLSCVGANTCANNPVGSTTSGTRSNGNVQMIVVGFNARFGLLGGGGGP